MPRATVEASILEGSAPAVAFYFTGQPDPATPDVPGDPADPTEVEIILRDLSARAQQTFTSASIEVTNPSVGTWVFQPTPDMLPVGRHILYARGTAGILAATSVRFEVTDAGVVLTP